MSDAALTYRVVLDTNVLLRSLVNPKSNSRKVVTACEQRKFIILISKPMLDEYRRVLMHLRERDESITSFHIEGLLRKLRYFGEYFTAVKASFDFPRDWTDAKMIELAIEGNASHVLTHDRDLLSLPSSRTDAGKRFRQRLRGIWVGTPDEFVHECYGG